MTTKARGARRAELRRHKPAPTPGKQLVASLLNREGRSKYGARRTYSAIIGRDFASAGECRFAEHLYAREQNGEISDLEFQRPVTLLGAVKMIPDFTYVEGGKRIWHEFKGFPTDAWKIQRKLWKQVGPGEYRVSYARKGDKIHPYRTKPIFPQPGEELIEMVLNFVERECPQKRAAAERDRRVHLYEQLKETTDGSLTEECS